MPRVRVSRAAYCKQWRKDNKAHTSAYRKANPSSRIESAVGVDSEGITDDSGRHICWYLAAWSEDECLAEIENHTGIKAEQFFDMLLELRLRKVLLVGFSLGYDYTKLLESLPTDVLTRLVRPEMRKGKHGPRPIQYGRYLLNYLRGRFTVTELLPSRHRNQCKSDTCTGCKHGRSATIWDVWGFFQGSFIDACDKWGVVTKAEYAELKAMKDRRSTFSENDREQVKAYCGKECRKLASLVTRLRDAHTEAGLPLMTYYGAGSTATVLLKQWGVKAHRTQVEHPAPLRYAIACAFFGGRFEIAQIGPYTGEAYSYDIASAYPYQLFQLPCLACGKWRRIRKNIDAQVKASRQALVKYRLVGHKSIKVEHETSPYPWGPFPLRTAGLDTIEDGCIIYPVTSGGGWVYKDEYLTGRKHWPNVEPIEAWLYDTDCDHHPFARIPEVYNKRLEWGKDGAGIVLKLGPNSVYGKLAQTLGDKPPFQSFEWAGMITSGCRAQLLALMAQDIGTILMTATDGIVSSRPLTPAEPIDTGTAETAARFGKSPLGAWEAKPLPGGLHMIRPGIAFPLNSATDEKETKARGIGKAVLRSHKQLVLDSWDKDGPAPLKLQSTIFRGLKSATSYSEGRGYRRADEYGRWIPRETSVSYMPEPKRPFAMTPENRLYTWALKDAQSAPYARILGEDAPNTAEVIALRQYDEMLREQPDREEEDNDF